MRVSLAGIPLAPTQTVRWSIVYGVEPQTATFEIPKSQAERVLRRARSQTAATGTRARGQVSTEGPIDLEFIDDQSPERNVTVRGLYVVGFGPGDRLNTFLVQVADVRWKASRTIVRRAYNMRRESGDRRLVNGELSPVQLGQSVADYTFRRATLKGSGVPYTSIDVVEDVLTEVFGEGGWKAGVAPAASDDVESLELVDSGRSAMLRVAEKIPGLEYFADYDGLVTYASAFDPADRAFVEALPAPNSGDIVLSRREFITPQAYRVYSFARTELRFDYAEGVSVTPDPGREGLRLQNVVVNPLLDLELPNGSRATVGEAVPVDDFLSAINDLRSSDGLDRPAITQADLRRVWLGDWPGWTVRYLQSATSGATRQKWAAIFAAIRSHWRRTFRVLPQWADKIAGLRAQRVAIMDAETGTRAKATAHTQYLTRLSQLALEPAWAGQTNLVTDDYADDLSQSAVSPFEVVLLNADQGLIQLSPRTDEEGLSQGYVLGSVSAANMPSADVRDALVLWGKVAIDAEFKLAVIVSAQKIVPNSTDSMHVEDVSLQDAADRLGLFWGTPDASGPDQELLALEDEGRYAWSDPQAEAIRNAYFDGSPLPESLLVNGEAMRALAVAHAARHLATILPRWLGTMTIPMRQLRPVGSIRQITHTVSPQGVGLTTIVAPGTVQAPSVWSLLPETVRRVVRGQIDRAGA